MRRVNPILVLVCFSCCLTTAVATGDSNSVKHKSFKVVDARLDFYTTLTRYSSYQGKEILTKLAHMYYNLTITNKTPIGKSKLTNSFFNEFGYKGISDSTSTISEDQYVLRNNFLFPLKNKKLLLNLSHSNRSQFWPHYTFVRTDSLIRKIRFSNYLSPAFTLFSGGLQYQVNPKLSFEFGVLGGKITKVKDQSLFESRKRKNLYGLNEGEKRKVNFGVSITCNALLMRIFKSLYWETLCQIFISKEHLVNPSNFTYNLNNAFHIFLLKYVRLTARTSFAMDKSNVESYTLSNHVSIGFYLNNNPDN
jgi:hypothetical protein